MPAWNPDYKTDLSMNKHLRTIGVAMIGIGILVFLSYFLDPLRAALEWFQFLPMPLQIGSVVAGIGLIVLLVSLLQERWIDRHDDAALKDD